MDDAAEFQSTVNAFTTIGVSQETQRQMFQVLAALLHLGNVAITATRNDANIAPEDPALAQAASFLGVDAHELRKWMLKRQIQLRGEKIVSSLSQAQALAVRDSVAKYIMSLIHI